MKKIGVFMFKEQLWIYLFIHWIAVFFVSGGVGGLVILDADKLIGCGALLVRHILVDLLTLLVVDGGADVLALGLVVRLVGRGALLVVDSGADFSVDVVGDRPALTIRGRDGARRGSGKGNGCCQKTKAD